MYLIVLLIQEPRLLIKYILNCAISICLEFPLRADLHGTTLTHATSLRQAYDMTWDHLHAYDIFTYKIKYAKVFTGIYTERKSSNKRKQIF